MFPIYRGDHRRYERPKDVEASEVFASFLDKFLDSTNLSLTYWEIEAGGSIPRHSHPYEQVAEVLEGDFELTVDSESLLLETGDVAVIPPFARHLGVAHSNCRVLDLSYPMVEDLR